MKKIILSLLLVLSLTACDNKKETTPNEKTVIKIVALYPMSGDAAIYGDASRKVAEAFLSEWKTNNPNAKYEYNVHFEDVQLSTHKAVLAMQRIVAKMILMQY